MESRTLEQHIKKGFVLSGQLVFGFFVCVAFFGGVTALTSPAHIRAGSWLLRSQPWALLLGGTVILIATMNRWVKILPGVLGYGTLGGLIMIVSGQYNHAPVPRLVAIALTAFCVASSAVSLSFTRRPLTLIDRFALMGFLFCFAVSMSSGKEIRAQMVPIGVGFLVLLTAWAVDLMLTREDDAWPPASSRKLNPSAPQKP